MLINSFYYSCLFPFQVIPLFQRNIRGKLLGERNCTQIYALKPYPPFEDKTARVNK